MRGSTWRRAAWRIGAAILIAIVLQLASAHGARASGGHVADGRPALAHDGARSR